MGAHAAVAEEQLDPVGARRPEPVELVDVGGELHERRHPRVARELRVLDDPAPILVAHEEVGEADELRGRERRLIDHVGL